MPYFQLPLPDAWKFDLVALLAILGESSINEVVYPLTALPYAFLPRLLPAPQGLIMPKRKSTLPSNPNARVVGAFSGNVVEQLPYFADALHAIDTLPPNTVQVMEVDVDDRFDRFRPRRLPVLGQVTAASSLLTVALFAVALRKGDEAAAIAIALLALAGASMSRAAQWSVGAPQRPASANLPRGTIVIYSKAGAFVIVKCDERAARTLYLNNTETCQYRLSARWSKAFVFAGSILLMTGILFTSNCSRDMQLALGVSYLGLNAVYMLVALSRGATGYDHWDFSLVHHKELEVYRDLGRYMETLWYAIQITQSSRWVRSARLAPDTPAWDTWLKEAQEAAQKTASALQRDDDFKPRHAWTALSRQGTLVDPASNRMPPPPAPEIPPTQLNARPTQLGSLDDALQAATSDMYHGQGNQSRYKRD